MDYYSLHGCKKVGNKISFWIFPGGRSGVSFTLFPRTVLLSVAIIIAALIFSAIVLIRHAHHVLTYDEDASVRLLHAYLQRRAVAATDEKARHVETLDDKELDAKIQLLVDEFVRVRKYEKLLRTRASALDTILGDALDLDRDSFDGSFGEEPEVGSGKRASLSPKDLGVGGGSLPKAPVVGLYPMIAKRVFKEDPKLLLDGLELRAENITRIPIGVPVHGKFTSGFGRRRSPFTRRWQMHEGVDYAVTSKTRVVATADGVVVHAGRKGAFGLLVKIDHGNGLETVYGHLSKISVKIGERVCRGELVGFVGNTGRSTGPHVHYEVRVGGVAKDPAPFIELASALKQLGS